MKNGRGGQKLCSDCRFFGQLGRCYNPKQRRLERGYFEPACEDIELKEKNMDKKTCKRCGRELPLDAFNKQTSSADGHQAHCRECQAEMAKERREKNKGAVPPPSEASEVHQAVLVNNGRPSSIVIMQALYDASDDMLISALRERGYTGQLSKVVTVTLE